MIRRRLLSSLTAALGESPAVALPGPRQVGKTTLALEVAKTRPAACLERDIPQLGPRIPAETLRRLWT